MAGEACACESERDREVGRVKAAFYCGIVLLFLKLERLGQRSRLKGVITAIFMSAHASIIKNENP